MRAEIGLLIIGSEILLGKRQDRHFPRSREQLLERGYDVAYCLIVPDRWELLLSQLRWAFAAKIPFFSFGGLGATPDDLTRACAAAATGRSLSRHPEADAIIRRRFGAEAEPIRIRMADLPEGAALIPNPINEIPGFSVAGGYFFPGFPQMAEPMSQWVLERYFPPRATQAEGRVLLDAVRESDLVLWMEDFCRAHPDLEFSSLPSFRDGHSRIELGIRGPAAALEPAWPTLLEALRGRGLKLEILLAPRRP